MNYMDRLEGLFANDQEVLERKREEYGDSWKKRGGVGAYMMLVRKSDRIEEMVKKHGWDVFAAFHADPSPQGIIDDIGDLRRYLALVEAELMEQMVRKESEKKPLLVAEEEGPLQRAIMDDDVRLIPRFNGLMTFEEICQELNVDPQTPDDELSDSLFKLKYSSRDILRNITTGTHAFEDARRKVMLELDKSR